MKQIINNLFNQKKEENINKDKSVRSDRVITTSQLEGMRQAYIYQNQIQAEQEENDENELDREIKVWTLTVKKGGD